MLPLLLVGLGGALGSSIRFLISTWAAHWFGPGFPYGTLIVNLGGSFLIGFVHEMALKTLLIPEPARLFLTVGVLGGLTTYSSFSHETVRLMESGSWHHAWVNIFVTTTICLSLSFFGIGVARWLAELRGGG